MKSFADWLKATRNETLPKVADGAWFAQRELPMIVECKCCTMTMSLPSAYIDEEGYTYCNSCAET